MSGEAKISPVKEIPNELNALDKEVAALIEVVEQLGDRTKSITSVPEEEVRKEELINLNCEVSERIKGNSSRIEIATGRIQSVLNRLHV